MWQKCPICNGMGISPIPHGINTTPQCPTCFGARIISEISGLPPSHYLDNTDSNEDKSGFNTKDIRFDVNGTSTTLSCHNFQPLGKTSSATKCKICGLEKWRHPQISFT